MLKLLHLIIDKIIAGYLKFSQIQVQFTSNFVTNCLAFVVAVNTLTCISMASV